MFNNKVIIIIYYYYYYYNIFTGVQGWSFFKYQCNAENSSSYLIDIIKLFMKFLYLCVCVCVCVCMYLFIYRAFQNVLLYYKNLL